MIGGQVIMPGVAGGEEVRAPIDLPVPTLLPAGNFQPITDRATFTSTLQQNLGFDPKLSDNIWFYNEPLFRQDLPDVYRESVSRGYQQDYVSFLDGVFKRSRVQRTADSTYLLDEESIIRRARRLVSRTIAEGQGPSANHPVTEYVEGAPREGISATRVRLSPEVMRVAESMDISPDKAWTLIYGHDGVPVMRELTRDLEGRSTEEIESRLEAWRETPEGKAYIETHRAFLPDTLTTRAKIHLPHLLVGGGISIAFGEALAHALDIRDPNARFVFVVNMMHLAGNATNPASEIIGNRLVQGGWGFTREVGGEVIYETRRSFFKAMTERMFGEYAEQTLARSLGTMARRGAIAAIRAPLVAPFHMGAGIACERAILGGIDVFSDELVRQGVRPKGWRLLPYGSWERSVVSWTSFFVPDLASLALSRSSSGLAGKLRLGGRVLGRATTPFAAGFAADLAILGLQSIALGDGADYQRFVEAEAYKMSMERDDTFESISHVENPVIRNLAYGGAGMWRGMHWVGNLIAPTAWAASWNWDNPKAQDEVRLQHLNLSMDMQRYLPIQYRELLAKGFGDEDSPDFYQRVDLSSLERIIPEGDATLKNARELQLTMQQLHFIHLSVNDPIRECVDRQGVITDEDAFLRFLAPGQDAAAARESILNARCDRLIDRISVESRKVAEGSGDPAELSRLLALTENIPNLDRLIDLISEESRKVAEGDGDSAHLSRLLAVANSIPNIKDRVSREQKNAIIRRVELERAHMMRAEVEDASIERRTSDRERFQALSQLAEHVGLRLYAFEDIEPLTAISQRR